MFSNLIMLLEKILIIAPVPFIYEDAFQESQWMLEPTDSQCNNL
jgi:hypothetical protein